MNPYTAEPGARTPGRNPHVLCHRDCNMKAVPEYARHCAACRHLVPTHLGTMVRQQFARQKAQAELGHCPMAQQGAWRFRPNLAQEQLQQ